MDQDHFQNCTVLNTEDNIVKILSHVYGSMTNNNRFWIG
jgi:hypothetical protein